MMQLPKCDKCEGTEFGEKQEDIEYILASEYFKTRGVSWSTATYFPKPMVCRKCGAEYLQGQFSYTI